MSGTKGIQKETQEKETDYEIQKRGGWLRGLILHKAGV